MMEHIISDFKERVVSLEKRMKLIGTSQLRDMGNLLDELTKLKEDIPDAKSTRLPSSKKQVAFEKKFKEIKGHVELGNFATEEMDEELRRLSEKYKDEPWFDKKIDKLREKLEDYNKETERIPVNLERVKTINEALESHYKTLMAFRELLDTALNLQKAKSLWIQD